MKNRELHELLGHCCSDMSDHDDEGICRLCGECYEAHSIHDYVADPRLVLREMKKRDDWIDFQQWCFVGVTELDGDVCYGVPIDLALGTTGELRDLAIEYLRSK